MENLLTAILFVTAAYCAWATATHKPTTATAPATPAVDPEQPIDYFPEVEEETTEPEPQPAIATEPEVTPEPAPVAPQRPAVVLPSDLSRLSIRQLKKLASATKLPRYSSLTKNQLIARLTALEVVEPTHKVA